MESKYYIPEIDEFYKGFEVEAKVTDEHWISLTIQGLVGVEEYLLKGMYRVKLLDYREIQEILKIEPKRGGSYIFEQEKLFRPYFLSGYVTESKMLFNPRDNWVKIAYLVDNEWNTVFEGIVKNKGQLKRILNQILWE